MNHMMFLFLIFVSIFTLQDSDPHRHLLTDQFPIPDEIKDPALRKLVHEALTEKGTRNILRTPEEREQFLKWVQDASKNPAGAYKEWNDLLSRNPDLRARLKADSRNRKPGASLDENTRRRFLALADRIAEQAGRGQADAPPANWRPHTQSEFMKRFTSGRDFNLDFSRGLNIGLERLQGLLDRFGSRTGGGGLSSDPGPASTPAMTRDGGGGSPSTSLPTLPGVALPGTGGGGGGTVILVAVIVVVVVGIAIYLGARRPRGTGSAKPAVWLLPRIPDRFDSPEAAVAAYRAVASYALQGPLTGLSHLEIESAVARKHPAAAGPAHALTEGFESLYYDPARSKPPMKPDDASRFLEALHGPRG
ncbi:MAG TPA: hypothetical protein VFC86_05805 [Planctomycetota bacterium]|nr:hypothetical protein [Planctomycetota bacterium]